MLINFYEKKIKELLKLIKEPIDIIYKQIGISNYKIELNMNKNELFSSLYQTNEEIQKKSGAVYTPPEIAEYIVKSTIKKEDIIANPFIKIIDPACGTGNILIECFKYLNEIYNENLSIINEKNNLSLNKDSIKSHIINNNIYGCDKDSTAIDILKIDLFSKSGAMNEENIRCEDFLYKDNEKYDMFLGNPPYIGQKQISKDYAKALREMYGDVYKDKSDILYCFLKNSVNLLNENGKISFITSRYFLESLSGINIRKYLINNVNINKIIDFYGIRPFKEAKIDPVILFMQKSYSKDYCVNVIKPTDKINKNNFMSELYKKSNKFECFSVNSRLLDVDTWILRNDKVRNIIRKIEHKCFLNLDLVAQSYQGIITGCDRAFIVDMNTIINENIERDLIKPWIKSKNISKDGIKKSDLYLIYSDDINNEDNYANSINHISKYKIRLEKRRECKRGIRKWYELQWGRKKEIFEGEKIVFPYKSSCNRFAMDAKNYFSADIYCLVLNDDTPFGYDYLLSILNSKVYDFYFKTYAKKLGDNLYEYYPFNLMKLCIPLIDCELINDRTLYDFFEFNTEEISLIENSN